jgi:hypothetical protein
MPNAIICLYEGNFEFIDRTANTGITTYGADMPFRQGG